MPFTFTHSWTLAASPTEVFAALTDAAQLRRWFAEHVEVTPRKGGKYRFWGKHTLGAPAAREATQRVTSLTRDRALAFGWTIHGVATTVAITLRPTPKGTVLTLTHAVRGELPVARQKEYIDDHWRFQFGSLAAHLARGKAILRPDFTDPNPQVKLSIVIDAPRKSVFRTLMEPRLVKQWFGSKEVRVTSRPGGEFWIGWAYKVDGRDVVGGTTRILELVPGTKLVLDWLDWRGDTSVRGQFISFTLEPRGARTRLIFVHGGFSRTTDISDYPFGWVFFLAQLKKVAERARA